MEHISTFLTNSVSFGFSITLISFLAATWLYKKTHFVLFSPLFVSSAIVIAVLIIFKIGHEEYVSLLPKSITTPIAIAITEQNGGLAALTIMMVSVAGIFCNTFALILCRLFKIAEPVARGVACGTCGHAMGTSKALEMGDVEGAMSGLSIAVCGVLSVIILPFFMGLN